MSLTALRFTSGLVCFHLPSLGSRWSFITAWYSLVSPFALEKGETSLTSLFPSPGVIFWKYPVQRIMFSWFHLMSPIQKCFCFTHSFSSSTPATPSKLLGWFHHVQAYGMDLWKPELKCSSLTCRRDRWWLQRRKIIQAFALSSALNAFVEVEKGTHLKGN